MRSLVVALGLITALSACSSDDVTALDAVVSEGDPPLGLRLDSVRVSLGPADDPGADVHAVERAPEYAGDRLRAMTVRLEPDAGRAAGTVYRLRAEGIVDDRVVVRVQHRVTFVAGRALTLPLRFEGTCIDVTCGGDQTCEGGVCVDDSLIGCALGGNARGCDAGVPARDAALPLDASSPSDAAIVDAAPTVDAQADTGPVIPQEDAGGEPGPDASACCPDDGLTCTNEICFRGECRHDLRSMSCLIDSVCYPDGANNPTNPCQGCRPASSQTEWTDDAPGTGCNDDLSCTGPDQCMDGVCVSPSLCEPTEVCEPAGCHCRPGHLDCNGVPDDGCECSGETCAIASCS